MSQLTQRCTAEALGAFMIVFAGCGAVTANQLTGGAVGPVGVGVSFGLVIMVMVYAIGHISGAHMNPAVTIGLAITRKFPVKEIAPYIIAQCVGAILAAVILKVTLTPYLHSMDPEGVLSLGVAQPIDGELLTAFVWEFILTFVLMFVIMAVATDARAVGAAAGLAIGGTVWFEATFAGSICGASMNPARSIGPAVIESNTTLLWVYIAAPIAGAVVGALAYQFMASGGDKAESSD
jgi:aquaporin NIP